MPHTCSTRRTLGGRELAGLQGRHRRQAVAERVRAGLQNCQRGARERNSKAPVELCSERGFGAEPQYNLLGMVLFLTLRV